MPPKTAPVKRERDELESPKFQSLPQSDPLRGWKDYFPPPTGDLDMIKLDLPEDRCPLEWWYYNCHFTAKNTGHRYSFFSSYFRSPKENKTEKGPLGAVSTLWSLIDVENEKYYADSLLDSNSLPMIKDRFDETKMGRKRTPAEAALMEVINRGKVPRPDRIAKKPCVVSKDRLYINVDDETVLEAVAPIPEDKQSPIAPKTVYKLDLVNPRRKIEAHLRIVPQMVPVRHGTHGVVNEMFYYYVPRCDVRGWISVDGVKSEVEGSGWYDREYGGSEDAKGQDAMDSWSWIALQLSDDTELSFFNIIDKDTHKEKERVVVFTSRDGSRVHCTDVGLSFSNLWTSFNTFSEYPMSWKMTVPSIQLDLHINTAFSQQEFMSLIVSGGGFFEGRIHAQGVHAGKPVTAVGFLERKQSSGHTDTKALLKNVGRVVKKVLHSWYPLDSNQDWIDRFVLGRHSTHKGALPKQVCDAMFKPVRALIDRGGKAWRSLVLVSGLNAVKEDFSDCAKYIAMSELLHVGSLIIDDIQDESVVRRGGKTVHLEYGVATAINAGTGCYFMAPILAGIEDLPAEKRAAVYSLYFDVLRAGHAGQGLDIAGLDHLMPDVVETGDARQLYDSLQAIHVYKTGGAAGGLCAIACVLADATPAQSVALENFGTQLGLAFQIVDDALNLKGFEGDLKEVGEDIRDGKITYPVIKAMSRLTKFDRQYVWSILQEHTEDTGKIASVIAVLNKVGAIDDCLAEARQLVEDAWTQVDEVLEDSLPKILMRTFCNYLTERTY